MEKYVKEDLERYIFKDNMSYDAIGAIYGVSGSAIRKNAKKLGIELPQRRKINPTETFNTGEVKTHKCLNCDSLIPLANKYCCHQCQLDYQASVYINAWKSGNVDGIVGIKWKQLSGYIRNYLFDKYNYKCIKCGWGETNPHTHSIPLEIHHIDGNSQNNNEDNLELLCPNCHSLTKDYRGANKGKGTRNITWISNN